MSMGDALLLEEGEEEDGEDLEGGVSYRGREGGRDGFTEKEEVKMEVDVVMKEEEEEEIDELEAFMSGVTKEVKNVDASDRAKLLSLPMREVVPTGEEVVEEEDEVESEDELDKVGTKAEDILA